MKRVEVEWVDDDATIPSRIEASECVCVNVCATNFSVMC